VGCPTCGVCSAGGRPESRGIGAATGGIAAVFYWQGRGGAGRRGAACALPLCEETPPLQAFFELAVTGYCSSSFCPVELPELIFKLLNPGGPSGVELPRDRLRDRART